MPGRCNIFLHGLMKIEKLFVQINATLVMDFLLLSFFPLKKATKMYKNGLNMKVVSKLMPLHMALTVHLTSLTDEVCKGFHTTTLASTTVLDSTQINIGM